jgi:hypothetical protein
VGCKKFTTKGINTNFKDAYNIDQIAVAHLQCHLLSLPPKQ